MPNDLPENIRFTFKVFKRPWNLPKSANYAAFLIENDWDDFGYKTLHALVVFDLDGVKHEVGYVKIGKFSETETEKTIKLSRTFESLEDTFFSLGQDDSYYENLNKLGAQIREKVLDGLHDLAANPSLWNRARELPITQTSLLRGMSEKSVEGQFHRMTQGGVRLSKYHFAFTMPKRVSAGQPPMVLSFNVLPESYPPTNIHVLIGRNGVGKTYLLNLMTHALVAGGASARQSGSFSSEDPNDTSLPFANLVSVTFSAFDPFGPFPEKAESPGGIKYSYIGLKRTSDTGKGIGTPKSPDMLAREFVKSVETCLRGARATRWRKALQVLETDSIFKQAEVASLADNTKSEDFEKTASNLFGNLSSGHKIVLLTITRLVETVEERTLVLLDEPEAHLHPPLLSAFIRALSDLLFNRNGVSIIATHSPVVLQEVPKSCVWKLHRIGVEAKTERPEIETFGENVGVLTREVFGLEVARSGFHKMLSDAADAELSYEAALAYFNNELGAEARAILRAAFATKDSQN
jgi:predicted ATPase